MPLLRTFTLSRRIMLYRANTYQHPIASADRHRLYGTHARDKEAKKFYNSRAWLALTALKLVLDPLCERCAMNDRLVPAVLSHHKQSRRRRPDLALSLDNLASLCHSCNSRLQAQEHSHAITTSHENEGVHACGAIGGWSPARACPSQTACGNARFFGQN